MYFRHLALLTVFLTGFSLFLMVPAAATLQELQVGAEAPDFRLQTVNGESKSFTQMKGDKLTVVVFWSTWSKKSNAVLNDLQRLYAKYHDRGLSVIAVNADGQTLSAETLNAIKAKIPDLRLEFPFLIDHQLTSFHEFGVIALPSIIILDGERIIQYELSGYPLVGSGEMKSFVTAAFEGDQSAAVAPKKGRQPSKSALRLYNMGKNTLKSKRMADSAETWFRKAIAEDPGFAGPHLSLGKIFAGRGDSAMAKAEYEQALSKEPDNVIALCEMGMLLVEGGKVEEGKSLFERTWTLDDAYTPCYYYAGYTYGKQGNLDAALKMFDEAAGINRLDFDIHTYKGRMYEELGRQKEATDAYRQALEVILSLN